jgi:hypothetical protein
MQIVNERVPWAEQWIEELSANNSKISGFDKANYNQFMELLYSSFYTGSVQGRPQAIQMLTFKGGLGLLNRGVTLSTDFKTKEKYGYQPVIADKVTKKLLKAYLECVRPKIVTKNQNNAAKHDMLWINYDGTPVLKISDKIIKFFEANGDLHVGSRVIRTMIETAAQTLQDNGVITGEERQAVHNVNGHSSTVTKNHYIIRDRIQDAKLSKNVFRHITTPKRQRTERGEEEKEAIEDDNDKSEDEREQLDVRNILSLNRVELQKKKNDWGSEHLHYHAKGRQRATWTDLEVRTIGDWCAERIRETPALRPQIANHCWKNFTTVGKTSVQNIFHNIHIKDNKRLAEGLKKAKKWAAEGYCKEYVVLLDPAKQRSVLEDLYGNEY